jgi:hypothetical protein
MNWTHPSATSLSSLVEGLVAFLREQQKRPRTVPAQPVPGELARTVRTFADHLVILMLVARSDDNVAPSEREVILRYCADRACKHGAELSTREEQSLSDYLRHFHPTLTEITSATERLRHADADEIAALIAAAHAVVEADGVVRLQEAMYLGSLEHALASIQEANAMNSAPDTAGKCVAGDDHSP